VRYRLFKLVVIQEQGVKFFVLIVTVYQGVIDPVIIGKMKVFKAVCLSACLEPFIFSSSYSLFSTLILPEKAIRVLPFFL
jgi:hypothetical protein